MKTNCRYFFGAALIYGSLITESTQAQITGINPAGSSAVIQFLDTTSFNGIFSGSTYTASSGPWNGSPWSLVQVDPTTQDSVTGTIAATGAGISYNISMNNISLSQQPGNTGFADLTYNFNVRYNIGAGGLPSLPTAYPNFLISGTIQNVLGSYASVVGNLTYSGVDASGVYGTVEQVNYNYFNNTPGAFVNVPISGVASNGVTPVLGPNTVFDVNGSFTFEVDPAHFEIFNIDITPEPTSLALAVLGVSGLVVGRKLGQAKRPVV